MTDKRPDPLVPAEVDLQDFPYTPIFRARLFGSSFHSRASDAEWRAGVTLWLKSWDQVPAGTLPDDDIDLCRLAELGRDIKEWQRIKGMALRGWTLCSDGRLHHRVVADGVLEAWSKRRSASKKGKAGASKRWGTGNASTNESGSPGHKSKVAGASNEIAQAMPGDSKRREGKGKEESGAAGVGEVSKATAPATPEANPRAAPPGDEGQGQPTPAAALIATLRKAGVTVNPRGIAIAEDWVARGIGMETLEKALGIARERKPGEAIPATYLAPIVDELLCTAPAGSAVPAMDRWWKSSEGVKAKGAEFGLVYEFREPGDFPEFKARVFVAAGDGPWIDERDGTVFRLVQELRKQAA